METTICILKKRPAEIHFTYQNREYGAALWNLPQRDTGPTYTLCPEQASSGQSQEPITVRAHFHASQTFNLPFEPSLNFNIRTVYIYLKWFLKSGLFKLHSLLALNNGNNPACYQWINSLYIPRMGWDQLFINDFLFQSFAIVISFLSDFNKMKIPALWFNCAPFIYLGRCVLANMSQQGGSGKCGLKSCIKYQIPLLHHYTD